jgi:hypothetical protein
MSKKPTTQPAAPVTDMPTPESKPRPKAAPKFRHIGGSDDDDFNFQLVNAAMAAAWWPKGDGEEGKTALTRAVASGIIAFNPVDEIEGMIAAQAVALHHASMECSRRAMLPDQGFEAGREYRKAAANASRTFVELLAALDRKRGKGGQQKVTVEHVHVHAGGKAIVGAVGPTGLWHSHISLARYSAT